LILPLAGISATAKGSEASDVVRIKIEAAVGLAHYEGTALLERIKNTKAPEKP
jgi:hypothetical protein